MELQEHLDSFDDQGLLQALETAREDLEIAARDQNESEWHQSCFAAVMVYANECVKRKLRPLPGQKLH